VSRQGVALFVLGVLVRALLLGDSISLPAIGDDAQAQGRGTWSAEPFFYCELTCSEEGFYSGRSTESDEITVSEFLATLPSSCQLEPMMFPSGRDFVLFYG
jgi:hypothetical protein